MSDGIKGVSNRVVLNGGFTRLADSRLSIRKIHMGRVLFAGDISNGISKPHVCRVPPHYTV